MTSLFSSLSSHGLSVHLWKVSSIFVISDHLSERAIMEVQTRRNHRMPMEEEQKDQESNKEGDDGGNGGLAQDEGAGSQEEGR